MTRPERIAAVDALRGIVMVLMALDHVRDFFTGSGFDPTDLAHTTPALFATRWVTHFCAPLFVFLAGTSAYLHGARGLPRPALARFLLTRGLWLVFLELTVVRFGWFFNLDYRVVFAGVIWAIGWSMVALAALVRLPAPAVGAFGVAMIAGHNLLDGVRTAELGLWAIPWIVLHVQGFVPLPGAVLVVAYPLVPWIGVMAAGYGLGPWLAAERMARRRRLAVLGAGLVVGFVVLRATNLYGDPRPWAPQSSALFSVLSFVNTTKYPPSLLFLAMTLGPGLLLLAWLDRPLGAAGQVLVTYGRVPLFYYVLHLPLIHGLAVAIAFLGGGATGALFENTFLLQKPPGYGHSLGVAYLVWAVVLAALYPPCRWFADVKRRRHDPWLSYI